MNKFAFGKILFPLLTLALLAVTLALVLYPDRYVASCYEALCLWAMTVAPALLPFFFLTLLMSKLGQVEKFARFFSPAAQLLYNSGGVGAFVQLMSFVSGYPVGAKLISELYSENAIDSREATKMSTYCSTSGPLFIAGSVGVGMFCDKNAGIILLVCHFLSAVINGVLFRAYGGKGRHSLPKRSAANGNVLYDSCYGATVSCLIVGTFIAIFYVLSRILEDFKILEPLVFVLNFLFKDIKKAEAFAVGLIECTRGCKLLSLTGGLARLPLVSAIIAFGGISVIAQSAVFLCRAKANMKIFILAKLSQMITAALLCLALCAVTGIR